MTAIALTIAGSDSSGGAGIQADLKTFAAHQVYGASVIVALTAQNTKGVSAIHIVLDPVMIAASGARLLEASAVEAIRKHLFPLATLITPNLPEAAALLGSSIAETEQAVDEQAEKLAALGAANVLVKGGHGSGDVSSDLLLLAGGTRQRFNAPRLATRNTHGTGCTLSSAIAANLARGLALPEAVGHAKSYISAAIAAADDVAVGHGHGPVHHFHHWWDRTDGSQS